MFGEDEQLNGWIENSAGALISIGDFNYEILPQGKGSLDITKKKLSN